MRPNAELAQKLTKRLTLQHETSVVPTPRAASLPSNSPASSSLASRLGELASERDKALERRQRAEDEGMHKTIELSSEVARLRVDVEVMRRDLEAARREVQELRITGEKERVRDQQRLEQSVHQDFELAKAEVRVENLSTEVQVSVEERNALQEQVRRLEEEVAANVVSRVRMEALLRKSKVKEMEMRKLIEQAEVESRAAKTADTVHMFSMHVDDEEEEKAGSTRSPQEMDDLEYSYEVAELAGAMSIDRALQLARAGNLWPGTGGTKSSSNSNNSKSGGETEESGGDEDYEAPLRELELALAHIRGGAGGADGAPAGTGEAADDPGMMDMNLSFLQEVLGRLTKAGARDPEAPSSEVSEEVVLPGRGLPLEGFSGSSLAEQSSMSLEEVSEETEEVFLREEEPPAPVAAAAVPAAAPEPAEPPAALSQVPVMAGFGLYQPYRDLFNQKYSPHASFRSIPADTRSPLTLPRM